MAKGDDAEEGIEDPDEEGGDCREDEHDSIGDAGDDGVELCVYALAFSVSE